MPVLRIHDRVPASRANGPGTRAVVWLQGCTLACPGCFNPETHDPYGGESLPVSSLVAWALELEGSIEGITISGGEPMQQARAVGAFLRRLRRASSMSTLLFTGYGFGELADLPSAVSVLAHVDVLISGRYVASRPGSGALLGSTNQEIRFLTGRYRMADLDRLPAAELLIDPEGQIVRTGIDPVRKPAGG